MINLSAAGLTQTEANAYHILLSKKEWKPSELAKNVGETRTNMYKILDKLVAFKLAEKFDKNKKLHYRATNPTRLLQLSQEHRKKRELAEKELELNAQALLNDFIKTHEQPGIRFFQGKEEIKSVYLDQVADKKPIYFMLSPKAIDYYGFEQMHKLRMLAADAQVHRYALTPDNIMATKNFAATDPHFLLSRTWLEAQDYTAPLEWGVYGDKVYFVTFGEDAMGMIIESKAMSLGFMQVFRLIERGQRLLPDYESLPRLAKKTAIVKNQHPHNSM